MEKSWNEFSSSANVRYLGSAINLKNGARISYFKDRFNHSKFWIVTKTKHRNFSLEQVIGNSPLKGFRTGYRARISKTEIAEIFAVKDKGEK